MFTRTTLGLGRGSGMSGGFGRSSQPEMTITVPWSPDFSSSYQQFISGGYANQAGRGMSMGGMGGMGSLGGMGGMGSLGGMGGMGGMGSMGGLGGYGGSPMSGGLGSFGGGFGGNSMNMGGGGGQQLRGTPIGFGVTTGY
ncbi:unnamed protein product [Adineta steineri]|uniref:Uncharacterized protein n=1 Tax=Adineta steineri TaxID=433720 RepID=A0A818L267_9BILA|nr:unnamed protein product [Adineta steineri]CAF0899082.1 unnamed protein product [Adineta steineri]CAF3564607.1 unnamed protein product [Adineta steineri]CAF3852760.1 unnamed protein product [Adineta steineri]